MHSRYRSQPATTNTRRGRHFLASSLDPIQLADLFMRSVDGPVSPVTSTLVSSQHIDGNILSQYTEELVAQTPSLLATEASSTRDSRVTAEVVDGLLRVSRRIRPQPKTSRSGSGTLSLRDIAARIEEQSCSSPSARAPSPPAPEMDQSISEWSFDEISSQAASEHGGSLDGGAALPVVSLSPETTYYDLDIEDSTLLLTPMLVSRDVATDAAAFPDPPEAPLPPEAVEVDINTVTAAADGERMGEAIAALLTTADRMIVTSTLVLLHHIARLDASIIRSATTSEPRVGHTYDRCQCQTSQASASRDVTNDDNAHSHVEVPFAIQEVRAPRPEVRDTRATQNAGAAEAPSKVPRPTEVSSTLSDSQNASATQTVRDPPPRVEASAASNIREPQPTRQRRDFVRVLRPMVRVALPQYADAEVQAGRGQVTSMRGRVEERVSSFVAM